MRRSAASEVTTAALVVLGIVIGAGLFYGAFSLAGRPMNATSTIYSTSTVYITSTQIVTQTSVSTTTSNGFSSSAQMIATAAIPGGGSGTTLAATCQTTVPAFGGYITLTNSGGSATTATVVSLTFAGQTSRAVPTGYCTIGASGSSTSQNYVVLAGLQFDAPGTAYTGSVSFSDGAVTSFSGLFE